MCLRVDEKNLREYNILNCCGVVITTNYKTDGIYLPADDRRHFVAWSDCNKEDFQPKYWNDLWGWYEREGYGHVAAYLAGLDISAFDPKAPVRLAHSSYSVLVFAADTRPFGRRADRVDQVNGEPIERCVGLDVHVGQHRD